MTPALAWNTAVSFVTNTNWQAYSGESTQGHLVQMAGLAVQNFVSAAVGMAVAIALVRGFARSRTGELGNFWVDLVRGTLRILLPICDRRRDHPDRRRRDPELPPARPGRQHAGRRHSRPSPAARSPARRPSRNSAPTAAASSTPTPRTRSRTRPPGPTGSRSSCCWSSASRCRARSAAWSAARSRATRSPRSWASSPRSASRSMMLFQLQHHGTVPTAVGAAMEGVEQRFGVANSAVFADVDHADLHGRGRLVPRLLHQPRRHDHAVQHAARRGRARRHRVPACTAC